MRVITYGVLLLSGLASWAGLIALATHLGALYHGVLAFVLDRGVEITLLCQVIAGALVGLLIYVLFSPQKPEPAVEDDPIIFGGSALHVEKERAIWAAMQQPKVLNRANFQASHTATVVDLASRQRGR